ncbi:MAG: hypothetical protein FWG29_01850 [Treponema sp.]|nr:hypothetical protein [Treponema sp.]
MRRKDFCTQGYGTRAQGICPFDIPGAPCRECQESITAFGVVQQVSGTNCIEGDRTHHRKKDITKNRTAERGCRMRRKDFTSFLRELYIAREKLNMQKGQRKDPDAADYTRYTWNDLCKEIGITRQTANDWLRNFIPAELSEDGKDHLIGAVPKEWKNPKTRRAG